MHEHGDDGPPPFVLGSMVDMGEQKGWQRLSADDYRANLGDVGQLRVYRDLDAGTWTGEVREWKRSGFGTAAEAKAAIVQILRERLVSALGAWRRDPTRLPPAPSPVRQPGE
jgi:hypothetical protein